MGHDRNVSFMAAGLLAVLAISLANGFSTTFSQGLAHVKTDLTTDALVHIYLLGWFAFLYGLFKHAKSEWF